MAEPLAARLARMRVPLGFVLAVVYLVFSRPSVRLVALGGGVAAAGLALRALAACYLEKDRALATAGPYAYTRNPLYLGSALLVAGFALAGGRVWLSALLAACFVGVYWPVMRHEERRLRALFPQEFLAYAAAVPLFFPRGRPWRKGLATCRTALYWQNREYRALVGYLAMILLLLVKVRYWS